MNNDGISSSSAAAVKLRDGSHSTVLQAERIVLPSEWAKLDVLTYHLFKDVFMTDKTESDELAIEDSPVVLNRRSVLGDLSYFCVSHNDCFFPVERGAT